MQAFRFVLLLSILSAPAVANDLGKLKRDIQTPTSSSKGESDNSRRSQTSGIGDAIFGDMFNAVVDIFSSTASYSFYRTVGVVPEDSIWFSNFEPRAEGDASLPIMQLETSAHNPWGDSFDLNYSLLAGYGAVAFKIKKHYYWESDSAEDLTLEQRQILLRFSFGNHLEIHQGFGNTTYRDSFGWRKKEASYTSPVLFNINPEYQIEFTPTWSASTSEYDISVNRTKQYYSLKLGYRQLHSENVSLTGFYLGVAAHF